ncbi:MAG TPA: LuxR C-terminal-related transcriptional regulator [Longimicrobiales bacterium]|nr:LuxR C-terminal-related transcriptional regulator [Longimicrobiales bacterium]
MTSIRNDAIGTRLIPPSLPLDLVSRPRLFARLDQSSARLLLISAPAGFGKTSLVVDWLAQRPSPVAWLSIDRHDNDPARFFKHLAAAVATLQLPATSGAAAVIETLAQRSGPVPELHEALAALGDDGVIVLDDVHELDAPGVLRGLQLLLEPRPSGPRMVLLTRVDPPFSLGRLRVSGNLVEIRERDLRFTRGECAALLASVVPGGLDPALVAVLEERTEGWAAGLRMAAIALHDTTDPVAAVASFAGTHRIVVDYLLEEAVERQNAAVQRFLLETSILERFTAETCAAVTQDAAAAAHLAEVEAANLFLVPLGADRRWYRYHHLFRELLEFRLRRLSPERPEELHARASAWFEGAGEVHSAIEHACRMEDRSRLLQLLDTHAMDIIARSELATLERWVAHLPAPLERPYPMLIVAIGWLRVLVERAPDLQALLAAAESALAASALGYDRARHWRARVQLDVLRGFAARFAGRFEEALEINRAVLAELPEEEAFSRGLVIYNQARLHMLRGEMLPAAQLLAQSFEYNLRSGNTYLVLTGLGQAAAVSAQREGVHRAHEQLDAAQVFAGQRHLTGLPAFSAVLYHLAAVAFLADRLDEAQIAGERAVELARSGNFPEGHANGLLTLARVAGARRRFDEARELLTELAALAQNRNIILADTTVALEQERLALRREAHRAGPLVERRAATAPDEGWTTALETELLLYLEQALRSGDHERAAGLGARLRTECEVRERGVALGVALVAEALLAESSSRWELLDRALGFAAVRGYVRPLLELGEPLRPVLQAALTRPLSAAARAHARLLLERLEPHESAAAQPSGMLLEPLTAREEQVLQHLCSDLSNKAIARQMYVSAETVKTHLKHVYWKLGATNRREALARARELGLAPPDLS